MRRLLCCAALLTAAVTGAHAADWVLAASRFEYAQVRELSSSEQSFASQLPVLVLEQIAQNLVRSPSQDELLERSRADLRTERLSLFLQLSAAVQERDSLVLTGSSLSASAYKKKLRDAQKKIEEIGQRLDGNIAEDAALTDSFSAQAAEGGVKESVVIRDALFAPSDAALGLGPESAAFGSEVSAAGINGLVSGFIRSYGDYVAVTLTLRVFPGAVESASVTEVGSLQDTLSLAESLAASLVPLVTNSLPVSLHFSVFPEEAQPLTTVTIDGIIYDPGDMEHSVSAGTHTIELSSEGFNTKHFTHAFTESQEYGITVSLVPQESFDMVLTLRHQMQASFYVDGVLSAPQPDGSVHLTLSRENVLGYMIALDDEGNPTANTAFFSVPQSQLADGGMLVLKANPSDSSAEIDRRRIWTYRAYTALILSLPATFICMGNFQTALLAYQAGSLTSLDPLYAWSTARYISLGVTAACGVFFIVELVRYLYTADSVIPSKASLSPLDASIQAQGGL